MGCGGSKSESNAALAMGLGPLLSGRINEIKRCNGIQARTPLSKELLLDGAGGDDEISFSSSKRVLECDESEKELKKGPESGDASGEESDEDGRELGSGDGPGSPSFRVYYFNSDEVGAMIKEEEGEEVDRRADSMDSNQGLRSNATKKDKRGRFQALKRGHAAAYNRMNIRSCYKPLPDSPRFKEKAT